MGSGERYCFIVAFALSAAFTQLLPLAGLAVGYWRDTAEVARNWALGREFQPAMPPPERARLYARWQQAVERSRGWAKDES